ncbi:MAG: AAA family ATPase [Simkaniaceae bacterium]|nr:AAA family ATPase [Simkaniaceae bacterium]
MNVLLFGVKGCGKTTIGKELAKTLHSSFIDTDRLIEDFYYAEHDRRLTYREIFRKEGAFRFRVMEKQVITGLQDVRHSVIAVGGGTMKQPENVTLLSRISHMIYLFCEKKLLRNRVLTQNELPAFIDPEAPEDSFDRMYDERHEYYGRIADELLDISRMTREQTVEQLGELVERREKNHGK